MKNGLKPMQYAVLSVIYMQERIADHKITCSSRFLSDMLHVDWQSYHNKMMLELKELGIVSIVGVRARSKFYSLTDAGRSYMNETHAYASSNVWKAYGK